MDITITVRRADAPQADVDVRVEWSGPVATGEVAEAVAKTMGMPCAALVWHGTEVPADHAWGLPPTVHGASFVVAAPSLANPDGVDALRADPTTPEASRSSLPARPTDEALFEVAVTAGPDCGQRARLGAEGVVAGRSVDVGLSIADPAMSRCHLRVTTTSGGITVEDLGATNGVLVDGRSITAPTPIDRLSIVRAGASTVQLRQPVPHGTLAPDGRGHLRATPSVRVVGTRPAVEFTDPPPAVEAPPASLPWVAILVPLPIAGVLAVLFGPQFLLFAALGPITMLATWANDRRTRRRRTATERQAHEAALSRHRRQVDSALDDERADLESRHPDPVATLDTAMRHGTRLWERTPSSTDFLVLRLGTGRVRSPHLGRRRSGGTLEPLIHARAPVLVDLRAGGGLTVVGERLRRDGVLRQVLGQLAVTHSPAGVDLIVLCPAHRESDWSWTRWLPHVSVRATPEPGLESISTHQHAPCGEGGPVTPVVVAVDTHRWSGAARAALAQLIDAHSVLVLESTGAPARGPRPVLTLHPDGDRLEASPTASEEFACDGVGAWWSERLARALAPVVDSRHHRSVDASTSVTGQLLGMTGSNPPEARHLGERWHGDRREGPPTLRTAYAVVGSTPGGAFGIDLDRDGPHLLVGGTTGSGKSEFLRALILGLAGGLPPAQLTFLLVDYKGGSTFMQARTLPHTVGLVSDLDPHLATRALSSLQAEVRRREGILAASGATCLADHNVTPGALALPRLVVIVDEFRALAQDHPELLGGLVRLAAVGRSLGIHLVLATQRPAGAITPDIQANVNLRIALRMRDAHDSVQVIGSPDAASLGPATPGTGFARSADGSLTAFTTFHVSGPAPTEGPRLSVSILDGRPTGDDSAERASGPTVEDVIVQAIRAAHHESGAPPPHAPWLPPLPEHLERARLSPHTSNAVIVGLSDHPGEQAQRPLTVSLGDGTWRFVGGPGSGRSSALRTVVAQLAERFGPAAAAVYAVSAHPSLSGLAGGSIVGATVTVEETGRMRRLLALLDGVVARGRAPGDPATVLVIDDWDLVARPDTPWAARVEHLVRTLPSAGGLVLASGGRGLGSARAFTGGGIVLLGGLEPADLLLHGVRPGELPQPCPPGRGLRVSDRAEVQLAHPGGTPPSPRTRRRPPGIFDLPERVRLSDLLADSGDRRETVPDLVVGVGDSGPLTWSTMTWGTTLLVAGTPGSGRTTTLRCLGEQWLGRGGPVLVHGPGLTTLVGAHELSGTLTASQVDDLERGHGPCLVLVDDADLLSPSLEQVLTTLVLGGDSSRRLALAVRPRTVATAFRGVVPALSARATAVLLGDIGRHDGEPLGVQFEPTLTRCPGRGLLVVRGRVEEIQVALAEAPPSD